MALSPLPHIPDPDSTANSTGPDTPWMRPAEAAAYLGIAIGTLRNWTSTRFVPYAKRGGVVRYHRDTLDRWLAQTGRTGRSRRSH